MQSLFPEMDKPRPRRRLLRRLIATLHDDPEEVRQGKQDRDTAAKERKLERELDERLLREE